MDSSQVTLSRVDKSRSEQYTAPIFTPEKVPLGTIQTSWPFGALPWEIINGLSRIASCAI